MELQVSHPASKAMAASVGFEYLLIATVTLNELHPTVAPLFHLQRLSILALNKFMMTFPPRYLVRNSSSLASTRRYSFVPITVITF